MSGINYCNFAETALRFMKVISTQVEYAKMEYNKKYDEKRLASDFEVQNIN